MSPGGTAVEMGPFIALNDSNFFSHWGNLSDIEIQSGRKWATSCQTSSFQNIHRQTALLDKKYPKTTNIENLVICEARKKKKWEQDLQNTHTISFNQLIYINILPTFSTFLSGVIFKR